MRQINWLAMLPQLALMLGLMILLEFGLGLQGGALLGAMLYLGLVFLLQMFIPHHHRQGLRLIRQGSFQQALECFQHSYEFFTQRLWLDKYRALTIFSASKVSYREMALLNIAYCYMQLKDPDKAKSQYQRVLQEFPDSEMAKDAVAYFEEEKEQISN